MFEPTQSPFNRACKTREEKRLLRQEDRFLTAVKKMPMLLVSIDRYKALGENRAQVLEYYDQKVLNKTTKNPAERYK